MDGLGEWVDKILTLGADVFKTTQSAKYQAQYSAQTTQLSVEEAKAKSKSWLYLGIGVIGAALLLGLVKKASRA